MVEHRRMDYEHHVFISYRHHESWPDWVEKLFMPPLRQWLGEEIGDDAAIFFDRNLETGTRWSPQIKRALARSRVLLLCFSRQYFTSEWCRLELALMLARERAIGTGPAYSLVVPIILHDGDDLPDLAAQLHLDQILGCRGPNPARKPEDGGSVHRRPRARHGYPFGDQPGASVQRGLGGPVGRGDRDCSRRLPSRSRRRSRSLGTQA